MVDLRPGYGSSELEAQVEGRWLAVGPTASRVDDIGLEAADRAVAAVLSGGLFRRVRRESTTVNRYFDNLDELVAYAGERWTDMELHKGTLAKARSLGPVAVRTRGPLFIQSLVKIAGR